MWKACYEAGLTGYVLYWQVAELGVPFEVVATTLVPMKAGDRVKTGGRDGERLARGMDSARAFSSGVRMALRSSGKYRTKSRQRVQLDARE